MYTSHGHPIPGTVIGEERPATVARCGGPDICKECKDEVLALYNLQDKKVTISAIADPDAPVTTNEKGGSQSDIPVRFDLIDAKAMFEMAKVLDHGAKKYGANNWRKIDVEDHLNHLLMHTYAYLAGDRTDEHLSHILCRATFALGVILQEDTVASN